MEEMLNLASLFTAAIISNHHRKIYWSNVKMKWWELRFLSARKILAPGEEENLELEEEEDAAAGGAGLVEAFPPRTPGTVLTLSTANATVWDASSVVACFYSIPSPRDRLTVCFFVVLSVGAVHGFLAYSNLLISQLRKVRLYQWIIVWLCDGLWLGAKE